MDVVLGMLPCCANCLVFNSSTWSISSSCSCSCSCSCHDGDDGGGLNGSSSDMTPSCCSFCSLSSELLTMISLLPAAADCIIVVFVIDCSTGDTNGLLPVPCCVILRGMDLGSYTTN